MILNNTENNLSHFSPISTSAMSLRFLELQQQGHVPIEDGNFNIEGFIPNKLSKTSKVAYLDFKLETGYLISWKQPC